MNIRPITSTPRAVAFAGSKSTTFTKHEGETTSPQFDKSELTKMLKLTEEQIEAVDTNDNTVTLTFKPEGKNRFWRVTVPTNGIGHDESSPINIDYFTRQKGKGNVAKSLEIEPQHTSSTRRDFDTICHLIEIAKKRLKKSGTSEETIKKLLYT